MDSGCWSDFFVGFALKQHQIDWTEYRAVSVSDRTANCWDVVYTVQQRRDRSEIDRTDFMNATEKP